MSPPQDPSIGGEREPEPGDTSLLWWDTAVSQFGLDDRPDDKPDDKPDDQPVSDGPSDHSTAIGAALAGGSAGEPAGEPAADRADPADTHGAVTAPHSSVGATVRTLVIVALLAMAGFLAMRDGGGDTEVAGDTTGMSARELMVIASDIAATVLQDPVTSDASSAYVPESGVVLIVTTEGLLPSEMSTWVDTLISPFAAQLAGLPAGEGLLVALHFDDAPGFDRLVRMNAADVADPAAWVVVAITGDATAATIGEQETPTAATNSTVATLTVPVANTTPETNTATTNTATTNTATTSEGDTATTGVGDVVSDDFASGDGQWKAIAGTWQVVDGAYRQTDALGFDLITRLDKTVPAAYQFEVRMRGIDGAQLNAGIVLAQANPSTREGAVVIDLVDDGSYIRWGRYATVGGAYEFIGGAALATPLDPAQWHALKVVVKGDTTIVYVDDQQIGDAGLVGAGGLGLVVSQSTVEFDDVKVTAV